MLPMPPLNAIVISNQIEGLEGLYRSNELVQYHLEPVQRDFRPDLSPYDLLIVPNGSDQIAMGRIRNQVRDFLAGGKALFCFDGWFTDWVPGNQWFMDNTKRTIDVRYSVASDRHHLLQNVDINALIFSHGISGWWACGYIEAAPGAEVLLADTWGRPVMVLDEQTTSGTMILTASGPVADSTYATRDDNQSYGTLARLYQNFVQFIYYKKDQYAANRVDL